MERIFLTDQLWVELCQDYAVVSWPGGHKPISYEAPVADLLRLLSLAVKDLLDERPDAKEVAIEGRKHYDRGFAAGWDAAKRAAEAAS